MRILAVIQARMSSSRLPGKVLLKLPHDDETVLARVVRAARAAEGLDEVVVATSTDPSDNPIEDECEALEVPVYRGQLEDVLSRFLGALGRHPADAVLRITADCPMLHPGTLSEISRVFRAVPGLDYLSTAIVRTLPRGMDAEIAAAGALRDAAIRATAHHRSHVTSYLYTHPSRYRVMGLDFLPNLSDVRVTLDTHEDWEVVQRLVAAFGAGQPPPAELGSWIASHPEVAAFNADVEQKPLDLG